MNDKAVKTAVDHFVKQVSFTAQSEIEKAVRAAISRGTLQDHETFSAAVTLSSEKVDLNITIYSKIAL
jgi:hypothetical protein